jgi:hypothetical protein
MLSFFGIYNKRSGHVHATDSERQLNNDGHISRDNNRKTLCFLLRVLSSREIETKGRTCKFCGYFLTCQPIIVHNWAAYLDSKCSFGEKCNEMRMNDNYLSF